MKTLKDEVLNRELAGTYTAFLIMKQDADAEREIVAAGDIEVADASDAVRARWNELKATAEAASEEEATNVSDALIEATSDLSFDTVGEESEKWQAVQTALEECPSVNRMPSRARRSICGVRIFFSSCGLKQLTSA